ncbi:MAG: spore coat U domain-containing protein [Tateyamaria sp.]|jgi:spore coat protein U-like protein|nr:spore coat U domain-containing protein [Tateyamaria sp.]MBT6266899.1 spore coat U domain-containing protein [Tateyamaria sp.]MBT6343262.1 spore coat U domain-containing protein [Tateyamaria sp.]
MRTYTRIKSCFYQTYQSSRSIAEITIVGNSKRNVLLLSFIALMFALIAQEARACIINITSVNFGSYDLFSSAALKSTGNIYMNCPIGVEYTIGLSAGSGTFEQREMSSGTHTLNYNLYTAANREFVWYDNTTSGATVSGSGTGSSVNHVAYGRIPPHQNVPAGSYSDTITVVITF